MNKLAPRIKKPFSHFHTLATGPSWEWVQCKPFTTKAPSGAIGVK